MKKSLLYKKPVKILKTQHDNQITCSQTTFTKISKVIDRLSQHKKAPRANQDLTNHLATKKHELSPRATLKLQ
jgi:gamma-glutamylcysteine synthetase